MIRRQIHGLHIISINRTSPIAAPMCNKRNAAGMNTMIRVTCFRSRMFRCRRSCNLSRECAFLFGTYCEPNIRVKRGLVRIANRTRTAGLIAIYSIFSTDSSVIPYISDWCERARRANKPRCAHISLARRAIGFPFSSHTHFRLPSASRTRKRPKKKRKKIARWTVP